MRCAVQVTIPTEEGNAAFKSGKMMETIGAFIEKWNPEAVYFFLRDGKRGALMIVNMKDSSQMPSLNEPLFEGMNAIIEVSPVMTLDDLKKGVAAMK